MLSMKLAKAVMVVGAVAGAMVVAVPRAAVAAPSFNFYTRYVVAFQDVNGIVSEDGNVYPAGNFGVAMAPGTSPSTIAVTNGGYEIVFHGSNGDLWYAWNTGSATGVQDLGLPMAPGTSPSTASDGLGYAQFVWHGANGDLWKTSPHGPIDLHVAMAPGTSPTITRPTSGGYTIYFQGVNGDLWYAYSTGGDFPVGIGDCGVAMAPGASPASAANGGFPDAAFEGRNGDLWKTTPQGPIDVGVAMAAGTTPSFTQWAYFGGYIIAVHGANGDLWSASNIGAYGAPTSVGDLGPALAPGSSPSVITSGFIYICLPNSITPCLFPPNGVSYLDDDIAYVSNTGAVSIEDKDTRNIVTIGQTTGNGASPSIAVG